MSAEALQETAMKATMSACPHGLKLNFTYSNTAVHQPIQLTTHQLTCTQLQWHDIGSFAQVGGWSAPVR